MSIVVFNAGSSSLKFGLFKEEDDGDDDGEGDAAPLAQGSIAWGGDAGRAQLRFQRAGAPPVSAERDVRDYRAAVAQALEELGDATEITAIGQRVVHGGVRFVEGIRIDDDVKAEIGRLVELAPLHNPAALEAIGAAEASLPRVPQVAVFDTSYYATLPAAQQVYPLPYQWFQQWGVRRFGFHGISHAYCATRAAQMLGPRDQPLHIITCHLGNGCSATASRAGKAIATTMGFTPIDGLMMGTRPGSVDPGILTYVQRQHGLTAEALEEVLNHASGLQGVSGVSSDYRAVQAAAVAGNQRAALALEIYAGRVREAVGALAVTLGRVDALVFAAGVGEHSAALRASASDGLQCLGLRLDDRANGACRGDADADIATGDSAGRILVVRTQEELMIAREVRRVMS